MDLRTEPGTTLRVPMSRQEYEDLGEEKYAEWWDGFCVVNVPVIDHQRIVMRLYDALREPVPSGFELYVGAGWRTSDADFIPDLSIASADATGVWLLEPPLLVVEVLSPSTRRPDLGYKLSAYARHGASWYWVLDPRRAELAVFRNDAGAFIEVQRVSTPTDTSGPVTVTIDPDALCG